MIVLVGFMGAGKSTVGRRLAQRLGLRFVDTDLLLEERAGRSIRQIFAEDGEPAFRAREHELVAELLGGPDSVLALGGGAVQDPRTRPLLASARVVYLRVSLQQALDRIRGDGARPLLRQPDLDARYASRLAAYAAAADVVVDTDGRPVEKILAEVVTMLGRLPAAGRPRGEISE